MLKHPELKVGWIHVLAGLVAFLGEARVTRAQGLAVLDGREVVLPGSTVNLGGVAVGVPKDFTLSLHNVVLANSGSLQVTNVGSGGAAGGDLEVLTAMPVTIPADRTASLRCRLTASAGGQRRAEVTIKHTGQPNPYTFAVTATATNLFTCNDRVVAVAESIVPAIAKVRTEGELTAGPRGYRFDVTRTAKYRFTLCEGQVATPGMRLCLLDLFGVELAGDDGSCGGGGEIARTLDPGGYMLAVSGPPGAFTLTTVLVPICEGRIVDVPLNTILGMFVRPNTFEGEIHEELAVGRRVFLTGQARCVFSFCQEGGSASFDSRLCLFDQEGEVVVANDDHCGSSSEIDLVLDRGVYTIAVSGAPGARGNFSLAMFVVPECSGSTLTRAGEITVASRPQLLQGALAAGEAHGYLVNFGDHDFSEFSFCRNGGSAGFDSVLCLFDSFGEAVALNDDFCGVNAHLHTTRRTLTQGMVVIVGRQSGGEYSLSYVGAKHCSPASEDFLLEGTLAPGLEPLTVDGSLSGDRESVWFVEVPSDGAYVFSFCEAPATIGGLLPQMCLRDAAGETIQEGQPCPENASRAIEIRAPLSAGDYLLSIGDLGSSTHSYKLVYYAESISPGPFRSCDFDCSGQVTITDPIATLGFLFLGAQGACCDKVADCNGSGVLEISDAVFALNFLFNGGQPPQFFLGCGGSGCVGYPCAGQ